jgi:hypothetical protein
MLPHFSPFKSSVNFVFVKVNLLTFSDVEEKPGSRWIILHRQFRIIYDTITHLLQGHSHVLTKQNNCQTGSSAKKY